MRRRIALALASLALSVGAEAHAQTAAEKAKAQAEIWAKEEAVYAGRASGTLDLYVKNSAPEYIGWPPYSRVPYGVDGIKVHEAGWQGQSKERLTMTFKAFTMRGDTAVVYYENHRTSLPDGTPVDQRWEIIHVFTKVDGDWMIIGGMQRPGGLERPKK